MTPSAAPTDSALTEPLAADEFVDELAEPSPAAALLDELLKPEDSIEPDDASEPESPFDKVISRETPGVFVVGSTIYVPYDPPPPPTPVIVDVRRPTPVKVDQPTVRPARGQVLSRARERRGSCNARRRGSRRSSPTRAGPDDGDSGPAGSGAPVSDTSRVLVTLAGRSA